MTTIQFNLDRDSLRRIDNGHILQLRLTCPDERVGVIFVGMEPESLPIPDCDRFATVEVSDVREFRSGETMEFRLFSDVSVILSVVEEARFYEPHLRN